MRDESGQEPSTSPPAAARVLISVGFVAVGLAAVFNIVGWIQHGQLNWRGLVTSLGIGLLLSANLVGPQRRALYYVLHAASIALILVSFLL